MIYDLIPYGSALYWALLFFVFYELTIAVNTVNRLFKPLVLSGITLLAVFGFSSYHPPFETLFAGVLAYLILGAGYAVLKWSNLQSRIAIFVRSLGQGSRKSTSDLAEKAYIPTNLRGQPMQIPPVKSQFRDQIVIWVLFWPCFTMFSPIADLHYWIVKKHAARNHAS